MRVDFPMTELPLCVYDIRAIRSESTTQTSPNFPIQAASLRNP